MYWLRIIKCFLFVGSLLMSFSAYAILGLDKVNLDGWEVQHGRWDASGVSQFNFSRPGLTPAHVSRNHLSGELEEYFMSYQKPGTNSEFQFRYLTGELYGVREIFDYCQGAAATDISACNDPPLLFSTREMISYAQIYMLVVDYEQNIGKYESNKFTGNYFSPPIVDWNWFAGYVYWREPQATRGNTYAYHRTLTQTGVTEPGLVTTGLDMAWHGSRLGVDVSYFPQGVEGKTEFNANVAYLLTAVSGRAFDLFYTDTLGGIPHMNYSATGTGVMSEVAYLYKVSTRLDIGISYRDWHLKAKGYLQTAQADPDKYDYYERYRLSTIETHYTGPQIFIKFTF